MIFKKYISNLFILRLCMLIMLIGSAAVFDMYHTSNYKSADPIAKTPSQKDVNGWEMYFCNPVNTFNFKTPVSTEFSVRFRFAVSQDKFLLRNYNLRTLQLMKAESLHSFSPAVYSFHSLPYNRVLYSSPDDIPPLS